MSISWSRLMRGWSSFEASPRALVSEVGEVGSGTISSLDVGALSERLSPGIWTSFLMAAVSSSLADPSAVSDSAQMYRMSNHDDNDVHMSRVSICNTGLVTRIVQNLHRSDGQDMVPPHI